MEIEITSETLSTENIELWKNELLHQKGLIITLDTEILNELEGDDAVAEEIAAASDFVIKIESMMNRIKNVESTATSKGHSNLTLSMKLPNLVLVKFNGGPLRWSKFLDLFRTSVHERTDLTSPAKFQYLLAQLEGEA